jgi:hypothetical protein
MRALQENDTAAVLRQEARSSRAGRTGAYDSDIILRFHTHSPLSSIATANLCQAFAGKARVDSQRFEPFPELSIDQAVGL